MGTSGGQAAVIRTADHFIDGTLVLEEIERTRYKG